MGKVGKDAVMNAVEKVVTKSEIKHILKSKLEYPENIANFERLKKQLTIDEAASIFTPNGGLKREIIDQAFVIKLEGGIKNRKVIADLTKDGSKIEDWSKYATKDLVNSPQGKIQVHFYKNKITGEVVYEHDYKTYFVGKQK